MTKSIPCVLALAVTSSLVLAQAPAPGGWSMKPGSGLRYDGGDAFGLKWTYRLQTHFTYTDNETAGDTSNFNIRRLRLGFGGHIYSRNILYKIELDGTDSGPAGDGTIKQGWAQWNFLTGEDATVGLRVGQTKTPYGLERMSSSGGLWFVERSSSSRAFSDNFTRGAWLNGVLLDNTLRWVAGAANNDVAGGLSTNFTDRGEEGNNSDNHLSYVFSANFDPLGDFFGGKPGAEDWRQGDWRTEDRGLVGTIGAALALGNSPAATALGGPDIESTSVNINTAWKVDGFNLLGEYFMRTDEQKNVAPSNKEDSTGWTVSLGYLLPHSGDSTIQWGFGVRVNETETDAGGNGTVDFLTGVQGIGTGLGTVREYSIVANAFYHGHNCKTQIEFTRQEVDIDGGSASDRDNNLIRIGFQIEM